MEKDKLNNIFALTDKNRVESITHYGNKNGEDIDVFLIAKGDTEYSCLQHIDLDITFVGSSHLQEMISGLDPLLTEPILTGRTIYGQTQEILRKIKQTPPTLKTTEYLENKSFIFMEWAKIHLVYGNLREACDCARFSASFCCFAEYYKKNKKIVTFSELIKQEKCFWALEAKKASKETKNEGKIKKLLEEINLWLTKKAKRFTM